MKNIKSMSVTQYRIFTPDLIPYRMIATPFAGTVIQRVMGFRSAARHQEIDEIIFQDGSFQMTEDGPFIIVPEMHINERRIIILVEGNSDVADQAYAMLNGVLAKFGDRLKDAEPAFFTEETNCVVELEFDWPSLLNPNLVAFANDFVVAPPDSLTHQYIKGMSVKIILGTRIAENLTSSGVVATDKMLLIESRNDAPLSDRVYWTSSPSDSETHLALIRDLEERLNKPDKRR
jgi:hypothetical protein